MLPNHLTRKNKILYIVIAVLSTSLIVALLWSKSSPLHPRYYGNDFENAELEKSVTDYLLTQEDLVWQVNKNSKKFCAIQNLERENEKSPLYVYAECEEYTFESGRLVPHSGFSSPMIITYPDGNKPDSPVAFSYEIALVDTYREENIKLFPISTRLKIAFFDGRNLREKIETQALAYFHSTPQAGINTKTDAQWEAIKLAIENCQVGETSQAHSQNVSVTLKNGQVLYAVEPEINDIYYLVRYAAAKCGRRISMATE